MITLIQGSVTERITQLTVGAGLTLSQDSDGLATLDTTGLSISAGDARYAQLAASNTMTNAIPFFLNNGTSNWIQWNTSGVGAPTFTTRSVGTKTVYYPTISSTQVDYAAGIESNTLWQSVPTMAEQFKWYGGTTQAMLLTGTGILINAANHVVGNGYLQLRGSTSAFGAIRGISGTTVEVVVGDGSAYAELIAQAITANGLLSAASGLTVTGTVTLPSASIADAALSSNIPRKNTANSFTNLQTFSSGSTWTTAGWNRSAQMPGATMLEFGDSSLSRLYGLGNSAGIFYGMTTTAETSGATPTYWMTANNLAVNFPGTLTVGAYAGAGLTTGDIVARRSATTGIVYFGDLSGYLYWNGTQYQMPSGRLASVFEVAGGNANGNYIDGQTANFGSVRMVGSYGGYAGIDFNAAGANLMLADSGAAYWGIWQAALSDWLWLFDDAQYVGGTNSISTRRQFFGVRQISSFTSGGTIFSNNSSVVKGRIHWDSTGFGLLDSAASWRLTVTTTGGTLFGAFSTTGDHTVTGRAYQQGEGSVVRRVASIIISASAPTSGDSAPDGTLWLQT